MATQTIKGITIQIGGDTTTFGKAIKESEDKAKSLGRELTDVNKLLKLDPENIDLLAQKQQILTEKVAATKEKLDILKDAEAQVQAQFERGEIGANQYRAFQREIAHTANAMGGYQIAIEQTTQQLTEAKMKAGEEASSLEELKTKISLQKQELSELSNQYKEVVFSEGENSQKATELKEKYNQLSTELNESEQKLSSVETAAQSLGQTEEAALTPMESLKSTISEQEQELDSLNDEYKNAVLQYGKNSDEAKALATQIKSLSDEHKANKEKLEETEKASKDVTATEKTLTEQYKDQKTELDDLKKQYVNAAAQYGKNSDEAKALAKQIDSLSGELAEEDKKIKEAEKSADSFDKTLDDTSQSADSTEKNVKNLDDSTGKLGTAFKDAATAVGGFMANLATELLQKSVELMKQFATSTLETGKTFEASMSNVGALSGATAEELQQLDETARQYGRDTQYSASECADALSYMALAGWDVEDMTAGLPGVLNLAAASQMDLANASDIVTDYMTAFGWEANRSSEFADKMAFAMSHSNTDTEMLGEAYKNCAATANSLNYSMEETTAAIMTMANAGVKGGEAGTAMNAVMTRLATDTKGCASALQQYGVEIYDAEGNTKSLSSILTGISDVWETLTDQEQANLAKVIAGQNQYSSFQTIMQGLSDTAKENGQSFEDYTQALMTCDGAASQMAKTMTDNLQGDLKKLESAFQDLQLSIYDGANTPMRTVIQTITAELLPSISDLVKGVDGADAQVGSAISSVASTTVNELTNILPQASKIFGELVLALVESLPQMADGLSQAISELLDGLVSALPTALPKILLTIRELRYQLFSALGDMSSDVAQIVQIVGTAIIEEIPKISRLVANEFKIFATEWLPAMSEAIPETISALLDAIVQNLPLVTSSLTSIVNSAAESLTVIIAELIPNFVTTIADFLNAGIPTLLTAAVSLFNTVLDALPALITALSTALPEIVITIVDIITSNVPVILDTVTALLMSITDALPQVLDALVVAIPEIIEKLVDFITSEDNLTKIVESAFTLVYAVIDCVPEIASELIVATATLVTAILTAIGERLPDMAQKGAELLGSLISQRDKITQKIVLFIPELVKSLIGEISAHFQELQTAGMNMFSSIWNGWTDLLVEAEQWGGDLIDNFVSGITGGLGKITEAAEGIGEQIWDFLHFSEPEKGKLADFSTYAPDMMATFADGISQNAVLIVEQLTYLSDSMGIEAQNAGMKFIESLMSFISTLSETINAQFTEAINTTVAFGTEMLAKAQETGKSFIDGIQSFISTLPQGINVHLTNAINNVISFGNNLVRTASSAASNMVSAIENIVRSLPDKMASVGTNLVQGLWNGIQGMSDWIFSQVSNFCGNILDNIYSVFDIHSPAKTTAYVGKMLDYGLAGGVAENQEEPIRAIRRMAFELLDETAVIPERIEPTTSAYTQQNVTSASDANGVLEKLDEILTAVKGGHVLMLDGDALVGSTIGQIDKALGQRQALAARRG